MEPTIEEIETEVDAVMHHLAAEHYLYLTRHPAFKPFTIRGKILKWVAWLLFKLHMLSQKDYENYLIDIAVFDTVKAYEKLIEGLDSN